MMQSRRPTAGHQARIGMTLVEMLVATAVTLLLMSAVAQLFGILGQGVTSSRSVIELNDQLRMASSRLRSDLAGITVATDPPARPDADAGYLEIVEGPATEANPAAGMVTGDPTILLADCDDLLLFTTKSLGDPFQGRFNGDSFESSTAEVAWFCKLAPAQLSSGPTLYTLYRRQLLVSPYVGAGDFLSNSNTIPFTNWINFYTLYDLSCHAETASLLPNSLGDLTRRENRFMHLGAGFPFALTISATGSNNGEVLTSDPISGVDRTGEDVVLTNVLAFDVRVYDPLAPIRAADSVAAAPGDTGYASASPTTTVGCYADLGWNADAVVNVSTVFPTNASGLQSRGVRVTNSPNNKTLGSTVYDTWSSFYESNGVDEDGDGTADDGTNGIDDNADGVVDDANEQETSPPYPVALRGLEVRIRVYEPSSRQVRQVTVRHTFVPH